MDTLKSQLVRLAYKQPEIRQHVLPLLKRRVLLKKASTSRGTLGHLLTDLHVVKG